MTTLITVVIIAAIVGLGFIGLGKLVFEDCDVYWLENFIAGFGLVAISCWITNCFSHGIDWDNKIDMCLIGIFLVSLVVCVIYYLVRERKYGLDFVLVMTWIFRAFVRALAITTAVVLVVIMFLLYCASCGSSSEDDSSSNYDDDDYPDEYDNSSNYNGETYY